MASSRNVCFAIFLFSLSFSRFDIAFSARTFPTVAITDGQAVQLKKPSTLPASVNVGILPSKSLGQAASSELIAANSEPDPEQPDTDQPIGDESEPSSMAAFLYLPPFLSSPSLPFPDLPLVPAIPLTPPSTGGSTTTTAGNKDTSSP